MRAFPAWILFIALFTSTVLSAQPWKFTSDHLTVDDGLSENTVWSMIQDSDGFLWLNTQAGLTKFDGYEFSRMAASSRQASTDIIGPIIESRDKRSLWIGSTAHGLYRFDRSNLKFEQVPPLAHDSIEINRPGNQNICALYEDNSGIVWLGTDHALNSYNPRTGSVTRFLAPSDDLKTMQTLKLYAITGVNDSTLWLGTYRGLYAFNKNTREFLRVVIAKESVPVYAVCRSSQNHLWIGTNGNGALRVDAAGKMLARLLDKEDVCTIYDDGSSLWFGTVSGKLLLYDERTGQGTPIQYDKPAQAVHQITAVVRDESGVVWIGTVGGGLYTLSPKQIEFALHQFAQKGKSVSPALKAIWSIAEFRDHSIWLGTGKGLAVLDTKGEVYRSVAHPSAEFPVRAIIEEENTVYLGLLEGGIASWERGTNVWNRYTYDTGSKPYFGENNVYCLLNDRRGNLWVGTNGGFIERFDKMNRTFSSYDKGHWDKWVLSLCEDRGGRIWIGTWASGIAEFDRTSGTFTYHTPFPLIDPLTSSDRVSVIHASDRDSNLLWLGTIEGGLLRFETDSKQFTALTEHDGLSSNTIYGILEDDFGNLWMSTNKGISRFDPRTNAFTNFDVNDGLQGNEFNLGAYLKGSDGTLYFGGDNGVNSFKPEANVDSHPPRVFLTGISVFGAPMKFDTPLSDVPVIELDYNRNQLTFNFLGVHYRNPAKNTYAYKLERHDSSWSNTGAKREASFVRLEPGEYVFKVKAANSDGVWSEPRTIRVSILSPLWQRPWFYVLSAVLIAMAGYSLRSYVDRVKRTMKQTLDANMHDDVNPHLSKISEELRNLAARLSEAPAEAKKHLQKIETEMDATAKEISALAGQFDPGKTSLFDLAVSLKDFSDHLFDDGNIAFELKGLSEEFEHIKLPVGWRLNIVRIFKEAMHNAMKHAGCANIILTMAITDHTLCIELCDDGQGFDADNLSRISGLKNMRTRAAELGGELEVSSQNGCGTKVRFSARLP